MITAAEALKLSKQNDEIANELGMIENDICRAAEKGNFFTYWYPTSQLLNSQYWGLKTRLEELGFRVEIVGNNESLRFYISWKEG